MLRDEVLRESEPMGRDAAGGISSNGPNLSPEDSLTSQDEAPQLRRAVAIPRPQLDDRRRESHCISCRVDFVKIPSPNPYLHVLFGSVDGSSFESDWLERHCKAVIHHDGDLRRITRFWDRTGLAHFSPAGPPSRRLVIAGELCGFSRDITGIVLEVPLDPTSTGIIGRRLSLVDKHTCEILSTGVIGWA